MVDSGNGESNGIWAPHGGLAIEPLSIRRPVAGFDPAFRYGVELPMHIDPLSAVPTDLTPTRRDPMLASTVRSRPPAVPSLSVPGMWQKVVAQLTVTIEAPSLPPVQLRAVPPVPVAPPVGL